MAGADILWGATAQEWAEARTKLPLKDLLPVVCRPGLPLTPNSKLDNYSKVPSLQTAGGVCGFARWSTFNATDEFIDRWSKDKDTGICLQTRQYRAIDIDIDDADTVALVMDVLLDYLDPSQYILRTRALSNRRVLLINVPESLTKRIIKVDGGKGLIELLADGQQVIVAGVHRDGGRNVLTYPQAATLPEQSLEQVDALWEALEASFGHSTTLSPAERRKRRHEVVQADDVAQKLEARGLVLGSGRNGNLYIRCPWEAEHTSKSDITATAYFPAGAGYEGGAFKCLHAHCASRTTGDFFKALKLDAAAAAEFPLIEDAPVVENSTVKKAENGQEPVMESRKSSVSAITLEGPVFDTTKAGVIKAHLTNIVKGLKSQVFWPEVVAWDIFREEMVVRSVGEGAVWRAWLEQDYVRYRLMLESRGFAPIGREMMSDAVDFVAREYMFDAAQDWLTSLPEWDGTPRVEAFFSARCSIEDSEYLRGVGRYLWTALAGRVMQPGSKADMVIVLSGPEFLGKSTFVKKIGAMPRTVAELDPTERGDNLARRIKGTLIGMMDELQGLASRDLEWFKAFASRDEEMWVPKFKELSVRYPRRMVLFGTTNDIEFLENRTGVRRWLPVAVGECDYASVERDAHQLWAEGLHLWRAGGIDWSVHYLAEAARAEHVADDVVREAWRVRIVEWLDALDWTGSRGSDRQLSNRVLFTEALGLDVEAVRPWMGRHLTAIMTDLNYYRSRTKTDRFWVKK